jgi:uncharacterized protein (TIGR02145 family)
MWFKKKNIQMKAILTIFNIFLILTGIFIVSCEEEEIQEAQNKTNKLRFTDIKIDTVSYREATISYKLENLDKNDVQSLGICYNTSGEPTLEDDTVSLSTSSSGVKTIDNISPDTEYHFRLYAKIGDATLYSNEENFSTNPLGIPVVVTGKITDTTAISAVCGGEVTKKNGSDVTVKGVCWNKSVTPTVNDDKTNDGKGLGSFTSNIENLEINTTYYVRAYATNEAGTSYGEELTFTTKKGIPTVTTRYISDITPNSAESGGEVNNNGGLTVLSRGVCWNTTGTPETGDSKTEDGIGTGNFTSLMTGLSLNTTYYVRAYVTTDAGTGYGTERTFVIGGKPVVSTSRISSINGSSAEAGGNILDNGGFSVNERGVCWSTSSNPTTGDNTTADGNGTGSYSSSITGLSPSTKYYMRAYATNEAGTAYGEELSFTTPNEGEVINPVTGQVWMDRNLGANRVAQSSTDDQAYGDLYQWGRAADGHEKRNSPTTSTLSNSDTPGHGNFITVDSDPYDWRSPHNDNLWQGVNGTNNPCPDGYHLPTEAEWEAERQSWSSDDAAGAFASPLKLPVAGNRYDSFGSLNHVGSDGLYWSSTVVGTNSRGLRFYSRSAGMYSSYRAAGLSVRCLKD